MKTKKTDAEKLVNAIKNKNNLKAESILTKILAKKVEQRYDAVINK